MNKVILVFSSVHGTFQAEEILLEENYDFTVVPVPPHINEGCGLGIQMAEQDIERAGLLLVRRGVEIIKEFIFE